jgi:hypothetical protein
VSEQNSLSLGHAFISYVREDAADVDRLQRALESAGVQVWRDKTSLWPGEDWRVKIREAITRNALVFIACFSHNSLARQISYQNEELVLAIDQMRLRNPDVPWLIPVRLSECDIPNRDIGGNRTLGSIHRADLFGDHREEGTEQVVRTVLRILRQNQHWGPEVLNGDGDLYLQGASLHATITRAYHTLERRLRLGYAVRVLLIRPGSPAARLARDRIGLLSSSESFQVRAQASLARLAELGSVAPDRLQVRLTDQELSFAATIIRPGSPQAVMYLEYYAYQGTQDGMRFVIEASGDRWYDYHFGQVNELWDRASPWTHDGP